MNEAGQLMYNVQSAELNVWIGWLVAFSSLEEHGSNLHLLLATGGAIFVQQETLKHKIATMT